VRVRPAEVSLVCQIRPAENHGIVNGSVAKGPRVLLKKLPKLTNVAFDLWLAIIHCDVAANEQW
jgi:hypothetical protein